MRWINCSDSLPYPREQVLVNDLNGEGVLIAWRSLWFGSGGVPTGEWQWCFQMDGIEASDVDIREWCSFPSPIE